LRRQKIKAEYERSRTTKSESHVSVNILSVEIDTTVFVPGLSHRLGLNHVPKQ
jgi:hypothetical protein